MSSLIDLLKYDTCFLENVPQLFDIEANEHTDITLDILERNSIELLRKHEPSEGYHLAFSGGKDSVVIKYLAERACVKFQAFYNVTTIDPPDLVYFIKKFHKDVQMIHPPIPFLKRLVHCGAPLRQARWCCREYKEYYSPPGIMIQGIRAEESGRRKNRAEFEQNTRHIEHNAWFLNPIIGWASDEVWQYIRENGIPYCKLYDNGWKRIGCLFCPNATLKEKKMHSVFYPKYEQAFRRSFNALHMDRTFRGMGSVSRWKDGDDMFDWWISGLSADRWVEKREKNK